jgi:hypothetical protein
MDAAEKSAKAKKREAKRGGGFMNVLDVTGRCCGCLITISFRQAA